MDNAILKIDKKSIDAGKIQEIEKFFYENLIKEAFDIDKTTQNPKTLELEKKAEE